MDQAHPVNPDNPFSVSAVYGWVVRQPNSTFLRDLSVLLRAQQWFIEWYRTAWVEATEPE